MKNIADKATRLQKLNTVIANFKVNNKFNTQYIHKYYINILNFKDKVAKENI